MYGHLSSSDFEISDTHLETKVATPKSPTRSTTPRPIVLPGVEELLSQIHESSKMPSSIPKNAPSTQDKATQTTGTQLGNPFFIPKSTHVGDGISPNYMNPDFGGRISRTPSRNPFEGNKTSGFARVRFKTLSAGGGIYEPGRDIARSFPAQNAGNLAIGPSAVHISSSKPGPDTHQMLPPPPFSSIKEATIGLGHKPTTSHEHDAHETNVNKRCVDDPEQNGRPWSSMAGILKQAAGPKPFLPATGASRTASGSKMSSPCVEYTNSRSTRPISPLIRTPIKAPKPSRRPYERHTIPDSPPTPKPRPPTPPLTPIPRLPPISQPPQSIDPFLIGRTPQSYPSSLNATPNRRMSPFQENPSQKTSVSAVLPRKRPVSPAIRPAKFIRQEKKKL
ncbi:hypothetical protein OCU04_004226 [Sclerotinia nivalis]|uniref:Uncharacterized protein n=1 Tax=Sclerotinia nivalis TaxID=352851 RepID=A0A9X0DKX9_9HELO|nr:hypothetical protein OCU04_004226 [Sclerotinia nivalis]